MIEIKHRFSGTILHTIDAYTLAGAYLVDAYLAGAYLVDAYLADANLRGANLRGANLRGANLRGANLGGADLGGADLEGANLVGANLEGADLVDANLMGANLEGANLRGATMPDGRKWEEWLADPLAGLCTEPEVRARAIAAWGNHTWTDCPMHAAFGWDNVSDAPVDKRKHVAAFVAVFDSRMLPSP